METRVSLKYFASGCSICIDNTNSPLALKNVKGITKISACYLLAIISTDQAKTQNTIDKFLF